MGYLELNSRASFGGAGGGVINKYHYVFQLLAQVPNAVHH